MRRYGRQVGPDKELIVNEILARLLDDSSSKICLLLQGTLVSVKPYWGGGSPILNSDKYLRVLRYINLNNYSEALEVLSFQQAKS
jgi:hypothetical protein